MNKKAMSMKGENIGNNKGLYIFIDPKDETRVSTSRTIYKNSLNNESKFL